MSLYPMVRRTITGIFFRDIEAVVISYRVYVRPYLWGTSLFPSASVRYIKTDVDRCLFVTIVTEGKIRHSSIR